MKLTEKIKRFLHAEKQVLQKAYQKQDGDIGATLKVLEDDIRSRMKHWSKSTVVWANVFLIASLFFETVSDFLLANPDMSLGVYSILMILGRVLSRHELVMREPKKPL